MCIALPQPDPGFPELQTDLSLPLEAAILLPPRTATPDHYHSLNSFHLPRLVTLIRGRRDKLSRSDCWSDVSTGRHTLLRRKSLQYITLPWEWNAWTLCFKGSVQCCVLQSKRVSSNFQSNWQNERPEKDEIKDNQSDFPTNVPAVKVQSSINVSIFTG